MSFYCCYSSNMAYFFSQHSFITFPWKNGSWKPSWKPSTNPSPYLSTGQPLPWQACIGTWKSPRLLQNNTRLDQCSARSLPRNIFDISDRKSEPSRVQNGFGLWIGCEFPEQHSRISATTSAQSHPRVGGLEMVEHFKWKPRCFSQPLL